MATGNLAANATSTMRMTMSLLESAFQDLKQAVRSLRRTPSFTLRASILLGLGIGANTTIFTLMDSVMVRSLPVEPPDGLVMPVLGPISTEG